jgi:hypothetical protein
MSVQAKLRTVPLTLEEANTLVLHWHRHHVPVQQSKFCIGATEITGRLCGAIIVGRPVARVLDNGVSLEVNRCVTDGTPNACSLLYGAAARAAKALGYSRIWTYTRADEEGASLRAAGWTLNDGNIRARSWDMPGRKRTDKTEIIGRQRWLWESGLPEIERQFPDLPKYATGTSDLFGGAA